jgi:chondroitin synthase
MTEKIFSKAIDAYNNGDIITAKLLYKKAGDKFGKHLIEYNLNLCNKILKKKPTINYIPFKCKTVDIPENIKNYYSPPKHLPKNFKLPKVVGLANNYEFLMNNVMNNIIHVSIIVLTYNRTEVLEKTLSGIYNQNYPLEYIEVIVVDDGGVEDTLKVIKKFSDKIDIKYIWHKDVGFTPAAARNNGINMSKNDFIILLDVDMYPSQNLVKEYVKYSNIIDKTVLIGSRRYIDLNKVTYKKLLANKVLAENMPSIITNNSVAGKIVNKISVDWRLEIFSKTEMLKNEKIPFRVFASGNVAFSKKNFFKVGQFDERFNSWGFEDTELGFRFFNAGLYMIPVIEALALHQEPKGGVNETDRAEGKEKSKKHMSELCPYYRHLIEKNDTWEVPSVSIYIPAYNAENTILDAIESVLAQTYQDIEVCICNDGSTDSTLKLLETYYSTNLRVRWVSQKNKGIGSASNTAVRLCRGIYVGQLDSDDYLAEDVIEKCVTEFEDNLEVGLVYTTNVNEFPDKHTKQGYNYPVYNRKKLMTASIVHHFRIFRTLYWYRTEGFNEKIKNAVDYDMYLKLSEVCNVKHLNIIGYRRRLHGKNTSIKNSAEQCKNTSIVINNALNRLNVGFKTELEEKNSTSLLFEEIGV